MIDLNKRDTQMAELLKAQGPRVSIFIPTHRAFPDNRRDPIAYKNQLQEAEAKLAAAYPRREWQEMLERLQELLEDTDFWNHTTEGLAVLAGGNTMATFRLDAPVGPMNTVGSQYHLPPIYPMLQSISQAYLADISRDRFTVHQVSREGVEQVELPDIKASFPELFDDFDAGSNLNVGTYSGLIGTHHGHRARPEEIEKDREKYFRYLDGAFAKLYRDTGLPLILAGTQSNLAEFRQLAKGDFYLEGAIEKPLDAMEQKELQEMLRRIMQPHQEKALGALRTTISNKRKENRVAADLGALREAAREGRVETLLVPGTPKENERQALDEAAEQVLLNGGEVFSLDWDTLDALGGRMALLRF